MTRTMKAAWGGLGVSVIALGLKFAAYWVTGSVALYSDALETTINVVGALTALIALWFSEQPADANHPYGHQRAEYISAAVEAFMVVAAALAIGREAYFGWPTRRPPPQSPHPSPPKPRSSPNGGSVRRAEAIRGADGARAGARAPPDPLRSVRPRPATPAHATGRLEAALIRPKLRATLSRSATPLPPRLAA